MKKTGFVLLVLFLSLSVGNLFSQSLKSYVGEWGNLGGTAKYKYYENEDYEKVITGAFSFYKNNKYLAIDENIKGNFSDGLKSGKWTTVNRQRATSGLITKTYTGTFTDGKRNGEFAYTIVANRGNSKTVFKFRSDTLIAINSKNLNGSFDDNGNFIGKWIYVDEGNKREHILEFDNNIIQKYIERRLGNPEIIYKYTIDKTKKITSGVKVDLEDRLRYFRNLVIGFIKGAELSLDLISYGSNEPIVISPQISGH
ncbi:hypothetical protein [Dysgonomonas sp. 520]|uniref:hypothetical protein n=1 Tax=Dysgonomonas sp. 520 TaxID=2302931 RepID=UPI0013CFC8BC|nr:hypothetical protein [Dysgonomonas sp. 520]NDW09627.1 hypothetical protein [Dysgonomonas sp. 520]